MGRLAWVLMVYGAGVAVVALLGPLVADLIRYRVVEAVEWQITGGDIAALGLVAPVSLASAGLLFRRRVAGAVMALAPAAFGAYVCVQLALGNEFGVQDGNSERFFPVFLVMFLLAVSVLIASWETTQQLHLPEPSPRLRRATIAVTLTLAAFLTLGLHLPGLIDIVGGEPYDTAYLDSPTVYWVVKMMDLGIVVPLTLVSGIGLLRHARWAVRVMYLVVGWGALLGSAVAGMAIVMQVNGDPTASLGNSIVFVAFALVLIGLAALIYRPLFQGRPL